MATGKDTAEIMKKVVISAFSSDAGESYRFHYGRSHSELVSKQVAKFVESSQGDDNF